jgi:hypothetical protein
LTVTTRSVTRQSRVKRFISRIRTSKANKKLFD